MNFPPLTFDICSFLEAEAAVDQDVGAEGELRFVGGEEDDRVGTDA